MPGLKQMPDLEKQQLKIPFLSVSSSKPSFFLSWKGCFLSHSSEIGRFLSSLKHATMKIRGIFWLSRDSQLFEVLWILDLTAALSVARRHFMNGQSVLGQGWCYQGGTGGARTPLQFQLAPPPIITLIFRYFDKLSALSDIQHVIFLVALYSLGSQSTR